MAIIDSNSIYAKHARNLSDDRAPCRLDAIGTQNGSDVVGRDIVQVYYAVAHIPHRPQVAAFGDDVSLHKCHQWDTQPVIKSELTVLSSWESGDGIKQRVMPGI
jgi:hypothetical protein